MAKPPAAHGKCRVECAELRVSCEGGEFTRITHCNRSLLRVGGKVVQISVKTLRSSWIPEQCGHAATLPEHAVECPIGQILDQSELFLTRAESGQQQTQYGDAE